MSEFIRGWLYAINNKTLRDEFAPDQLALSDMQLQRLKNVPEDDDFDEVVMPTSSVVHSTESGLNLFHSAIQLQAREDLVMCQLLAGVVSAITLRLDHSVASNANLYLRGVARVGWLVHVESLLSTRGKEEGMLEVRAGFAALSSGSAVTHCAPPSLSGFIHRDAITARRVHPHREAWHSYTQRRCCEAHP